MMENKYELTKQEIRYGNMKYIKGCIKGKAMLEMSGKKGQDVKETIWWKYKNIGLYTYK